MKAHLDPLYPDAVAVVAGLARLVEDLSDLQSDVRTALGHMVSSMEDKSCVRGIMALDAVALQLRWLADDVLRMQSALTGKEKHHAN
jgi:hypothetical protein